MEIDISYQTILGATLAEFAVRALWAGVGGGLTMLGFWGLRRRVRALETKQSAAVNITINNGEIVRSGVSAEGVIGHQTDTHVTFGTTRGPITVSLAGGIQTSSDIVRWLHDTRLLAPLGGENRGRSD